MSAIEQKERPMVDLAYDILKKGQQPISFYDLMKQVAEMKEYSEVEAQAQIARFYTTVNIDARFLNVGETNWGLREWYPVDQQEDELKATVKPKRKKETKTKKKQANKEEEPKEVLAQTDDEDKLEDFDEEIYEKMDEEDKN